MGPLETHEFFPFSNIFHQAGLTQVGASLGPDHGPGGEGEPDHGPGGEREPGLGPRAGRSQGRSEEHLQRLQKDTYLVTF